MWELNYKFPLQIVICLTMVGNGMPTAKEAAGILYNEVSHQYDMFSSANAIDDLTKD